MYRIWAADKNPGGQKPQGTHMLRTVESTPGTKFRGRFAEKNSWVQTFAVKYINIYIHFCAFSDLFSTLF